MITKEISNVEKRAAFKMNKTITEQISPQNNQHIKRKAAEIHHLLSVILEKKTTKEYAFTLQKVIQKIPFA